MTGGLLRGRCPGQRWSVPGRDAIKMAEGGDDAGVGIVIGRHINGWNEVIEPFFVEVMRSSISLHPCPGWLIAYCRRHAA